MKYQLNLKGVQSLELIYASVASIFLGVLIFWQSQAVISIQVVSIFGLALSIPILACELLQKHLGAVFLLIVADFWIMNMILFGSIVL